MYYDYTVCLYSIVVENDCLSFFVYFGRKFDSKWQLTVQLFINLYLKIDKFKLACFLMFLKCFSIDKAKFFVFKKVEKSNNENKMVGVTDE